jgi:hypothetical protein
MKVWSRAVTAAVGIAFGVSVVAAYAATSAPPSAPRNLKATAQDRQVILSWSSPTTGAPIDSYQVITTPADFPRTNTTTTTITADNLTNGTTYSFAVRAHNANGYGPAARITASPHVIPPSPPNNLAATQGPGAGQITLSWTPPTSGGSSNVDHYTVTVNPGGTKDQVSATTTTYVASNLADNITYTFTVTATNTRGATGKAAVVYAPLPVGATIGLQPTAGTSSTVITVTGQLFLKNESMTLYWDISSHVAATVVTDDNGSFTKAVRPFARDKPAAHRLCVNAQPKPCASFALQPAPTPTASTSPSPVDTSSPTPSAAGNPQASGARPGGGGISGLDIITRPPFVFLPIIGILGLIGVLVYWALSSRRRPMAPTSASVIHHATRPDYMEPFPSTARPPAAPPVAAPPIGPPTGAAPPPGPPAFAPPPPAPQAPPPAPTPPVQPGPPSTIPPPAWERPPTWPPEVPPAPVEAPPPPTWPAAPDEPPDLPQPSD